VVHALDQEALRIWPIAREMKGKILAAAPAKRVIARNPSFKNDRRQVGLVTFAYEVFPGLKISRANSQPRQGSLIGFAQGRVHA